MDGTTDKDKLLWLAIRRGLLLIVGAIEQRYGIGKDKGKGEE
jgi:hypothetical protein